MRRGLVGGKLPLHDTNQFPCRPPPREFLQNAFLQNSGAALGILLMFNYRTSSCLAYISHHLTAEARNRPAITSLRLLAVLNVLSEYASARQAARASY